VVIAEEDVRDPSLHIEPDHLKKGGRRCGR
jgi:hypothetical protein